MADMLVWLGFEYKKTEEGYIFIRSISLIGHGQMFIV